MHSFVYLSVLRGSVFSARSIHMTADDFRKLALALPETEERSHMNHPDFRVAGKIFATLGYPDKTRGMVKLSPEEQHYFSKDYPDAFIPVKGAWGRRGATSVLLESREQRTFSPRQSRPPGATQLPNVCWCADPPKKLTAKRSRP